MALYSRTNVMMEILRMAMAVLQAVRSRTSSSAKMEVLLTNRNVGSLVILLSNSFQSISFNLKIRALLSLRSSQQRSSRTKMQ